MMAWPTNRAPEAYEHDLVLKEGARLGRVRLVHDCGIFDRREVTQYRQEFQRTSDTTYHLAGVGVA